MRDATGMICELRRQRLVSGELEPPETSSGFPWYRELPLPRFRLSGREAQMQFNPDGAGTL
jgi:hypothetical protein